MTQTNEIKSKIEMPTDEFISTGIERLDQNE